MQQLKNLTPKCATVLVQPHVVAGDQVTWTESDADIPAGTVGTVQVVLRTTEKGRVPVKFPRGTFDLKRSQLKLKQLKAEVDKQRKAEAEAKAQLQQVEALGRAVRLMATARPPCMYLLCNLCHRALML